MRYFEQFLHKKRVFVCIEYTNALAMFRAMLTARTIGADGLFVRSKVFISDTVLSEGQKLIPNLPVGFTFRESGGDSRRADADCGFDRSIPVGAFGVYFEKQIPTVCRLRFSNRATLVFSGVPEKDESRYSNYQDMSEAERVREFVDVLTVPFPPVPDTPENKTTRISERRRGLQMMRLSFPGKGLALVGYLPDQVRAHLPLADCVIAELFNRHGKVDRHCLQIIGIVRKLNL